MTKSCPKTTKTSNLNQCNKAYFLLVTLTLVLNSTLIYASDVSIDDVKHKLDKINSQPGKIDEINMPTKCESCIMFARDFEDKAMQIPLKLVIQ
jgi:hypothetical protein